MDPKAAFPIMMGSCAFLMPIGSLKFIRHGRYSLRTALGLGLGGTRRPDRGLHREVARPDLCALARGRGGVFAAFSMLRSAMVEAEAGTRSASA